MALGYDGAGRFSSLRVAALFADLEKLGMNSKQLIISSPFNQLIRRTLVSSALCQDKGEKMTRLFPLEMGAIFSTRRVALGNFALKQRK